MTKTWAVLQNIALFLWKVNILVNSIIHNFKYYGKIFI